jgi:hypothetical protein
MPVNFVQIWPSYHRSTEPMTMQGAIGAFLRLPEDARGCAAIEPIEPYTIEMAGRPVTIAILSFLDVEVLAARPDFRQS